MSEVTVQWGEVYMRGQERSRGQRFSYKSCEAWSYTHFALEIKYFFVEVAKIAARSEVIRTNAPQMRWILYEQQVIVQRSKVKVYDNPATRKFPAEMLP